MIQMTLEIQILTFVNNSTNINKNEQSPLILTQTKTMTNDVGNPGTDFRQAQQKWQV
jgi:hypothetical protein